MDTTPTTNTETNPTRDGILSAIGVVVLLLGTATGNALAMLGLAAIGLAIIVIAFLRGSRRKMALTVTAATATAIAFAVIVSRQ